LFKTDRTSRKKSNNEEKKKTRENIHLPACFLCWCEGCNKNEEKKGKKLPKVLTTEFSFSLDWLENSVFFFCWIFWVENGEMICNAGCLNFLGSFIAF
jgi:hypothetical protein